MCKKRLAWMLIMSGCCFGQDVNTLDQIWHKNLAIMLPFVWPSSMEQAREVRSEDVLRLLQDLFPEDALKTVFAMESFRFAPLEKDKFYLVAVADGTGRNFFNSLEIIRCKDRRQCNMTSWRSDAPNDLDEQVIDIDGDGVFEIVTKERVREYDGIYSRPMFAYSIRKFEGPGRELVDVSSKHPKYFEEHILPKMDIEKKEILEFIESLEAGGDNSDKMSAQERAGETSCGTEARDMGSQSQS